MNRFVVLALIASTSFAHAQQRVAPPQSTDPAASVPPVQYESAFARYTPYAEQDPDEWKKANEEVARAGGHVKMFEAHADHIGPTQGPAIPAPARPVASRNQAVGRSPAADAAQSPPDLNKGH